MVEFQEDWYNNLIAHSNEKGLLVQKIATLLQNKHHESCLEIGIGTSAHFADNLSKLFEEYWIVEKNKSKITLPENVRLIQSDIETIGIDKRFDVVFASHVVYYFNNLPKTIDKIVNLLSENGRVYFVVNGKGADYGLIKNAFANFISTPYTFTYDNLKNALSDYKLVEYTIHTSLSYTSYEDLYEAMRLSFDLYPKEYEENKENIVNWLKGNIKGGKFFIDQKIIEVSL